MTAIREALQWYADEAAAIARHLADFKAGKGEHAIMASLAVLSLDAGNRARAALSQEVPQPDDETTWTADYRAGYEAAVAACCALGWKTPQEVPQESVPAGYVLVDLNEYDGDDPRADADTDRWMAAADAFVKANPHNMRGLAEWECQMRAAINVLATPGAVYLHVAATRETFDVPLYAAPPKPGLSVVPAWIPVSERLPPCDGEAVFVGINTNGYAGCFNAMRDLTCFMDSPEDSVLVMSFLAYWMPLPPIAATPETPHE